MMKLRYKINLFMLTLLCVSACNVPRDNVLDPRNPDSRQTQKVLIQAFVNTGHESDYNACMLQALQQLEAEHGSELIVAAHHRSTPEAESNYHTVDNELLYQTYLSGFDNPVKGVPDVFFNGIHARVQGASSEETALLRLQNVLTAELKEESHILIDADFETTAHGIKPRITLAGLGERSFHSILVKCLLTASIDRNLRHVVVDQKQSRLIASLKNGEPETADIPELVSMTGQADRLVVYVTDSREQIVYQSACISL